MNPRTAFPIAGGLIRDTLGVLSRGWRGYSLVVLAASSAVAVVVVLNYAIAPSLFTIQRDVVVGSEAGAQRSLLTLLVGLGVPTLLLIAAIVAVGIAVIVRDVVVRDESRRLAENPRLRWRLGTSVRSAPAVVIAATIAAVCVAVLCAGALIVSAIALLAFAALPIARLLARKWGPWSSYPSARALLVLAIPFAACVLLAVRWSLAVPAAVLERGGPLAALRRSSELVRTQSATIAIAIVAVGFAYFALQAGISVLGLTGLPAVFILLVQAASQVTLGALPLLLVTVIYLRRSHVLAPTIRSVAPRRTVRSAVAVVASISLVLGFAAPVSADAPLLATVMVQTSPNPSTEGDPVTASIEVTSTDGMGPVAQGSIIVRGLDYIREMQLDADGRAEIIYDGFAPGSTELEVNYNGDDHYGVADGFATHTTFGQSGGKQSSAVSISASSEPARLGSAAIITAAVTAAGASILAGTVDVSVDGVVATGQAFSDGVFTWTLGALAVGNHEIVITYPETPQFLGSSATYIHTVTTAAVGLTVTTTAQPARLGEPVTITVAVDQVVVTDPTPTGIVTFTADGGSDEVPLFGGIATLTTSSLSLGDHEYVISFGGDAYFDAASTSHIQTIAAKYATAVSVAGPTDVTVGEVNDFTATITSSNPDLVPMGSIEFVYTPTSGPSTSHVITVANGVAADQFAPSASGNYVVDVYYRGDADNSASSASITFGVGRAASTMQMVGVVNETLNGHDATFTATVGAASPGGPTPTGTVTFTVGTTSVDRTLVGGVATYTTAALPLGTSTVSASYLGDDDYFASQSSIGHTVVLGSSVTTLVVSPSATAFGQSVEFIATVTAVVAGGPAPTGAIEFSGGGPSQIVALDSDGRATVTLSTLPVGSTSVVAAYSGDAYLAGSAAQRIHIVDKSGTTTALASSPNPSVTGQSVTFTATVVSTVSGRGVPDGVVTFLSAGSWLGDAPLDTQGVATLEVTSLVASAASREITADYGGSTGWRGSTATHSQFVTRAAIELELTTASTGVELGDEVTLTVTARPVSPSEAQLGGLNVIVSGGSFSSGPITLGADGTATVDVPTTWVGARGFTAAFATTSSFTSASSTALSVNVSPFTPRLQITATAVQPQYGDAPVVTVSVDTPPGFLASGTLDLYRGGALVKSEVLTLDYVGHASTSWTCSVMLCPIGSSQLSATFTHSVSTTGDATSQPFTLTVAPRATVMLYTASDRVPTGSAISLPLNVTVPGWTSALPYPTGTVEVVSQGTVIASAAVAPLAGGTALGTVDITSLPVGLHPLTLRYVPDTVSVYAASSRVLDLAVYSLSTSLLVSTSVPMTPWGVPVTVSARVEQLAGQSAPTGTILITEQGGAATCTVTLPATSCELSFSAPGQGRVLAEYTGDPTYGAASTLSSALLVTKRVPALTVSVSNPTPVQGDTVVLEWSVTGPITGAVTLQGAGTQACPTTLAGTCQVTISSAIATPIEIWYAGDALWASAVKGTTVIPVGCFPLTLGVLPAQAGTLTASSPPNCGNGTGYLAGTDVIVRASAAASGTEQFEWALVTLGGSLGSTRVVRMDSPVTLSALYEQAYRCYSVTLVTNRIAPSDVINFAGLASPTCPVPLRGLDTRNGWVATGQSVVGNFVAGSTASARFTTFTATTQLFGYRWNGGQIIDRSPASFTVRENTTITAVVGPSCYRVQPAVDGDGRLLVATAPNCTNPREGWQGYRHGTSVQVAALPASGSFGYITAWTGADGAGIPITAHTRLPLLADTLSPGYGIELNTVTLYDPSQKSATVTATFSQCYRLDYTVQNVMYGSGNVRVVTGGNCPRTPGSDLIFAAGTAVSLEAMAAPTYVRELTSMRTEKSELTQVLSYFGSWNAGDGNDSPSRTVVMDRDRRLVATFWGSNRVTGDACAAMTVGTSHPALLAVAGTVTARSYCALGSLNSRGHTTGASGRYATAFDNPAVVNVDAVVLEGNPLVGWVLQLSRGNHLLRDSKTSAAGLAVQIRDSLGTVSATAVACQGIDASVQLTNPSGATFMQEASDEGHFVMASPAPNCPFDSTAWTVGTTIEVAALADPVGYTFTGWSEGASGTTLATKITLDGSSPSMSVVAAYTVSCFTLTLTHDKKDVTVYPQSTCPGSSPEQFEYAGGTVVAMYGAVPGGKVWKGWVGDVVQLGKVNPAIVIMDDDKTAGHRWRSKDAGETVAAPFIAAGDFFVDISDDMAIASKKFVGVMALAAEQAVQALPPMGFVTAVTGALSLVGTALEAAGVGNDITKYLHAAQQMVDAMMSGVSCAAVWGLNGNGATNLFASEEAPSDDDDFTAAAKDSRSIADRVASGELRTESDIRAAMSESLAVYETVTGTVGTVEATADLIKDARAGYYATVKSVTQVADLPGLSVISGTALGATGIVLGGGFGIDKNANAAWTDGSAYWQCMADAVPWFMK